MKRFDKNLVQAAVFGAFLVAANPRLAHAYIDPGVGLLVVQGVIASAVGALFFARRLVYQVLGGLFGRRPKAEAAAAPATETEKN